MTKKIKPKRKTVISPNMRRLIARSIKGSLVIFAIAMIVWILENLITN